MVAPDSAIFAFAEEEAETKVVRILRGLSAAHGPDIADAAIEGIVRGISVFIGDPIPAFNLFTRAADAELVPALKTKPRAYSATSYHRKGQS